MCLHGKHANTQKNRPRLLQKEDFSYVQGGPHKVYSFENSIFRHNTAAASIRATLNIVGLYCPSWLWLGGTSSLNYLTGFATLLAQSMRHGAWLGPTLALWCARQPLSNLVAGSGRKDPRESKISPFRSLGSNVFPRGHSSRVCAYLNSKVTNLQFISSNNARRASLSADTETLVVAHHVTHSR